jgi:hypothetical protein
MKQKIDDLKKEEKEFCVLGKEKKWLMGSYWGK